MVECNALLTVCRTCMSEEDTYEEKWKQWPKKTKRLKSPIMVSIYQILSDVAGCTKRGSTIIEMLQNTIPQLHIQEDDELPKYVCEICVDKLMDVYQFQQMCIRADQQLKGMLTSLKASEINNKLEDPLNNNMMEAIDLIKVELDETANGESPLHGKFSTDKMDIKHETKDDELAASDDGISNCDNPIDSDWVLEDEGVYKTQVHSINVDIKDLVGKKKEIFTCDVCGNGLSSRKSLKRHKKLHPHIEEGEKSLAENITNENEKCVVDERKETINESESTKVEGEIAKKKFACDICGSLLATRKSLKRHKKIHLRLPKDTKIRSVGQKTIYKCTYCTKAFQQSSTLKDHLRIHTGEQPFLCAECGKAFKSLSNMKQHLLRHKGEKRYECPHCPKKFPCLSDLSSHKAVHYKVKSHVCDLCGAGFIKPYQLKKHKMYHNGEKPHKCEYCEMRFVLADQMRRHMRTHTGEKPYKCKYCVRAFAQSNDLIKHLRVHLGDKVYKCELCPQGFRLVKDLREHFASHKNEDDETRARNLQALVEEEKKLQIKFGVQ